MTNHTASVPEHCYGQTRSFNLGIAKECSIEAALVYDELAFWSGKSQNDGWIYKTHEEMMERLPLSKYQLREAYKTLQKYGYIEIDFKQVYGTPKLHFRQLKNLTVQGKKTVRSMEGKKTVPSIYTATATNIHQYDKGVEKLGKNHRGEHSKNKEKIREAIRNGGLSQLKLGG